MPPYELIRLPDYFHIDLSTVLGRFRNCRMSRARPKYNVVLHQLKTN